MIDATGADAALLPAIVSDAILPGGLITARNLPDLLTSDPPIETATLTGANIRSLLERAAARFPTYDFRPDGPPSVAAGDSAIDEVQGVSYELDLTRPPGERVIHLSFRGESLAMDRKLAVAVSAPRAARGDPELSSARAGATAILLKDALVARAQRLGQAGAVFERSWTVLPDYAPGVERPLIDRLVRAGALPREEAMRLFPDESARRGELAYWLARAFGWREQRLSGAYSDVPDSLQPWVDGLARHHVLDPATRTSEQFQPFGVVTLATALAWCGSATPGLHEMKDPNALRGILVRHTSLEAASAADTVTRAQALGMVANARFFSRK